MLDLLSVLAFAPAPVMISSMSHAIAFDTLAFANKLKAAGVPERQAETHAEAIASLVNEQMATKRDLAELEATLRRDLADVRRDMKELEMRLTIRLGTMMVIAVGVVATLVKLM